MQTANCVDATVDYFLLSNTEFKNVWNSPHTLSCIAKGQIYLYR
jgi:hypothetical protein